MIDARISKKIRLRNRTFIIEAGPYLWLVPKPEWASDDNCYSVNEVHSFYDSGQVCTQTARLKDVNIPTTIARAGNQLVEFLNTSHN